MQDTAVTIIREDIIDVLTLLFTTFGTFQFHWKAMSLIYSRYWLSSLIVGSLLQCASLCKNKETSNWTAVMVFLYYYHTNYNYIRGFKIGLWVDCIIIFYELTISAHVVRNPASRANSVVSLISTLTRMIESTSLVFVLQFLSLLAMSHCMACCQTSKKDKMAETSEESITGQETNLLHVVDFNLCAFMINDIWKQSQLQTLNLHIPSMICIMRIMHLMADFLDQMKLM